MSGFNVIVPAKELSKSKTRLLTILSQDQRNDLVLCMLRDVLQPLSVNSNVNHLFLVSSDPLLIQVAKEYDAEIIEDQYAGDLNRSLQHATNALSQNHPMKPLLIVPSDVPLINRSAIDGIAEMSSTFQESVVLATASRSNGTNALLRLPPDVIETQFGTMSFEKHKVAADEKMIPFVQYANGELVVDLDTIQDMKDVIAKGPKTLTAELLIDFLNKGVRF
jgi:2-phospho-L-lactate guanylyltransferase